MQYVEHRRVGLVGRHLVGARDESARAFQLQVPGEHRRAVDDAVLGEQVGGPRCRGPPGDHDCNRAARLSRRVDLLIDAQVTNHGDDHQGHDHHQEDHWPSPAPTMSSAARRNVGKVVVRLVGAAHRRGTHLDVFGQDL